MEAKIAKLSKKLKKLEKLSGGDDESASRAEVEYAVADQQSSESNMDQAYMDLVNISDMMKEKIREVANMNTMGNVQLGLGEAWYQVQGMDDDLHIECCHCGGKIPVRKLKKKLYKRKVRRNMAKGKPEPVAPKFLRKGKALKKRPGPKKGGAKTAKQSDWISYCKAVGKTPEMAGKPWNDVMKKASALRKKGVLVSDIKKLH
jgi:RNA polymerase-binding transcription factor DksA